MENKYLERLEKTIALCRDKEVDIYVLSRSHNVQEYNYNLLVYGKDLTEEEFKELKEVLKEVFNKVKKEDK